MAGEDLKQRTGIISRQDLAERAFTSATDLSTDVNAISMKEGRRQKMVFVAWTTLPVLLLFGLTIWALFSNVLTHVSGQHLRSRIMFGAQISDVVYNMQRERDMASFYLSSHKRSTKADLVLLYRATDKSIAALDEWPVVGAQQKQFRSRKSFTRSLNDHRYALEAEGSSQRSELTDYLPFITVMMDWLVTSINVPEASQVYTELVAMQEVIEASNSFGLMRAYGAICYTTGGFRSRADYVLFMNTQAIADTMLQSAIEYSNLLRDMHTKYVTVNQALADTISTMRLDLTRRDVVDSDDDLVPDFSSALWWFDNMTLYTDALQLMTTNVRQTIVDKLETTNREEVNWLMIIGATLVVLLGVCGVMVREAIQLLKDHQESSTALRDRLQSLSLLKQLFSLVGWCHLPPSIANALADDKEVPPKVYGQVTAMSVSVTGLPESSAATADEIIEILDKVRLCIKREVDRSDVVLLDSASYDINILAGLEDEDEDDDVHALTMARVALDLMDDVTKLSRDSFPSRNISLRIAINTGSAILGLIEKKKVPKYNCFGDILPTLNDSEDGKILLNTATYEILKRLGGFIVRQRKSITPDNEDDGPTGWLVKVDNRKKSKNK